MKPHEQLASIKQALRGQDFTRMLEKAALYPLHARSVDILQMNITRRCNLSCRHCHVEAGPHRSEQMSKEVFEKCREIAALPEITTVDVTGGAPEMHALLPWFLDSVAPLKKRLIVRSNLVILLDPVYRDHIDMYARNGVELVAPLPDPDAVRTDKQRGSGVFKKTIEAMRVLNKRGYGVVGSGMILDLVHNPAGAYPAGPQKQLEEEFRRKLSHNHGVTFTRLFCLTNSPIGRFLDFLVHSNNLDDYMEDLSSAFNRCAAENVMCRTTLSVGWDGTLYDCDFNQMLALPVNHGAPNNIMQFTMHDLATRQIVLDNHCFACTAGAGSSCQGTTA